MKLNLFKFLGNRAEQSALKSVIESKLKDFEENLSYVKIDWKKSPREFEKMKSNELIALKQAVNCLNGYIKEIKIKFEISSDVLGVLNKIENLSNSVLEIANVDNMVKIFKDRGMERWDEKKEGPFVIEPMSSALHNEMQHLWVQIHKLRTADFNSILSDKLETDSK